MRLCAIAGRRRVCRTRSQSRRASSCCPWPPKAQAAAKQFGTALASLTPCEAAHLAGTLYTTALPAAHRSLHGIFYTPPQLVDRLLAMAEEAKVDWRTARVLDPACGDGAFLLPMALRMVDALTGSDPAIILQQRLATAAHSKILVHLPNGETRQMEAEPSSVITKAVIEVFAPRFLGDPAVLWISESGNKVIQRDDELAQSLGLKIETDKLLPDTILVDLAPAEPLLVFIEAVATDVPITEARRGAFLELITAAGFKARQVAFVTAFRDRDAGAFKKAIANLAWGSFAWCLSEPEHLIALDGTRPGGIRVLSDFTTPKL